MPAYLIALIFILIGLLLAGLCIIFFKLAAGGWNPFNVSSINGLYGFKFKGFGPELISFDDCKYTVEYKFGKYRGKSTRDVTNVLNQMSRVNYNATPFQNDKPPQNVFLDALTPISFLAEDSYGNVLEFPGIEDPKAKEYLSATSNLTGIFYNYGIYKFLPGTTNPDPKNYCTVEQISSMKEKIMDNFDVAYICTLTGKVKNADIEKNSITNLEEQKIYPIRFNSYGSVFKYKCPVICTSPNDKSCVECCKRCYTYNSSGTIITGMSDSFPNDCGCSYKSTCEAGTSTKDCYKLACPYNVDKKGFDDAPFSWNSEFTANRGSNILTGAETGDDLKNYAKMFDTTKDPKWLGRLTKGIKTTYEHNGFIDPFNKHVMWKTTDTKTYKCMDPYSDSLSGQCNELFKYVDE